MDKETTLTPFLLRATEAELDEMIWLVDQLKDRIGVDWEWFVNWAAGDRDNTMIRSGLDVSLMIPATAQAVINWLTQYKQRGHP